MADQEITLKPGQKIKPSISNEIAQKLVQKLFNLESTSIKELNSYDDRNFHIKVYFKIYMIIPCLFLNFTSHILHIGQR